MQLSRHMDGGIKLPDEAGKKSYTASLFSPTLSPVSVVQTPCCTTPNSPSPSILLMVMESMGINCLPGGLTTVETGRETRCSGGEGLNDRPAASPPPRRMACFLKKKPTKHNTQCKQLQNYKQGKFQLRYIMKG